jgi:hypothetical protein
MGFVSLSEFIEKNLNDRLFLRIEPNKQRSIIILNQEDLDQAAFYMT